MRAIVAAVVVVSLAGSAGCSSIGKNLKTSFPDRVDRPATDAPGQFVLTGGALNPNGACQSPLFDPRDQTRVTLVRSDRGTGDYQVPDGKYGVGPGELLRVDCTTGRAVGVVRGPQ